MDPYGGIGGVGGVPVGGMGAGVVGRSWTGDFEPGLIFPNRASTPSVVPANQFSIFIEPAGGDCLRLKYPSDGVGLKSTAFVLRCHGLRRDQ